MTGEIGLPPHTEDLPPTARLVYRYLDDADRPCTARELAEWCRAPKRTVNDALRDLQAADLVERTSDAAGPNAPRYALR